jgi:DNA replication protein DnaC
LNEIAGKKKRIISVWPSICSAGGKRLRNSRLKNIPRYWAPEAYDAAVAFNPERDNLYLWGPPRVGKTHLSSGIARKFLDRKSSVFVSSVPNLISAFRILDGNYDHIGRKRFIEKLVSVRVLVLHEFGMAPSTEYVQEILWAILDGRIMDGWNGLVMNSKFSLKDIADKHGGTISERIKELCSPAGIIRFPERRDHREAKAG